MKTTLRKLIYGLCSLAAVFFVACEEDVQEIMVPQPLVNVAIRWGGSQLEIPAQGNFSVDTDQTEFRVPLGVELSTVTLDSFDVKVAINTDTIEALIANGTLVNTVVLSPDQYSLPTAVKVPANTISAPLHLVVDFDVLEENPGKKIAIAVRLTSTSNHRLVASKSTTVVVIDADAAIAVSEIGDVTAKYLNNTGYPFISTEREFEGGRWGNLDHWTANDAAKSHNGYGGFNSDAGGTMGLEAGWGSPNIPNGKVYQTTLLPAGKYGFEVAEWEWNGIKEGTAYFVAAAGSELPDFDAVEDNSIGFSPLSNGLVGFTLAERSEVTLGVVVNFVDGSGQGFKIKQLKLIRLE